MISVACYGLKQRIVWSILFPNIDTTFIDICYRHMGIAECEANGKIQALHLERKKYAMLNMDRIKAGL